jgi:hypothetical protein
MSAILLTTISNLITVFDVCAVVKHDSKFKKTKIWQEREARIPSQIYSKERRIALNTQKYLPHGLTIYQLAG